ncbi:glycoside hydrolase family 9 protein [Amycolatopsis sp. cmx-4-68]|uniref:glycoside hydrolase family 9 protein n=1 Tax=Amycolatopsis sp. cmx-4-68 TaxID=2790938 RepID=UPI00397CE27F
MLREDPDPVLAKEVRFGLDWLDKMWDGRTRTLYAQVGIGTGVPGAALGVRDLAADLRRQLDSGVESATKSPFRTAADVTDFDAASRSFGFAATARLHQRVTGDTRYAAFGAQQRDFTLGANAWGVSLVVGVGTRFPQCPHHQAANLAGPSKVLYGAVVHGPNGAGTFADLPFPAGGEGVHPSG